MWLEIGMLEKGKSFDLALTFKDWLLVFTNIMIDIFNRLDQLIMH